jgi:hypothetical protein
MNKLLRKIKEKDINGGSGFSLVGKINREEVTW